MFNHFLITRFNLRATEWNTNKKNKAVLTDEWHKNRFQLFTDFCFPSVASQTNKYFKWLVFFDISTPEEYKKLIATLEIKMSNFIPLFIDGMSNFLPSIRSYIEDYTEDYIITSRLDNDDCISKYYIDEVQKKFNNQDFMALDFINGYTIQTQPTIKIGKKLQQHNPFITLIEKNHNPITIWHIIRHAHWKREKNILQVRNTRIWTSIIHQENKVNEFTGYGKVNLNDFFENFEILTTQKNFINNNVIPLSKWIPQSFINAFLSYWKYYFKNFKKKLGVYNTKML